MKIFSVIADERFPPIVGTETLTMSAKEYPEEEIQRSVDENAKIRIRHVQFSSMPVIPKTASYGRLRMRRLSGKREIRPNTL